MGVWVLFVIILSGGHVSTAAIPMKDQATCEAHKADAIKAVLETDSTAQASLTCFKANPVGKIA